MRLFEYKKELENVKGIKCTHDLLDSLVYLGYNLKTADKKSEYHHYHLLHRLRL